MDKGLLTKDLAKMLGVSEDSVLNWEVRGVKPLGKHLEKLRDLIGVEGIK